MANNQNFIVKHGLTVGGNQYVIDTSGNWVGPDTPYANASFARANSKTRTYTQDTPPTGVNVNDIWIDSSNGVQYVYVTDVNSSQWVELGPFAPLNNATGNIAFTDQTLTGVYSNRDVTIYQSGTGNITLQSANTVTGNLHTLTGWDTLGTSTNKWKNIYTDTLTSGNIVSSGITTINNSSFLTTQAAVRITGSSNYNYQLPSNDGYMLHITAKDSLPSRVVLDSYGTNTYGLLAGRSARGTASSPTPTQNNDVLMRIAGNGYGTTGFASGGAGRIDIVANENYTDAARGTRIEFWNNPPGTNTAVKIASFNSDTVTFNGTINAGGGFTYTPRVDTSNNTTHNISFTTDSFVRLNVNDNTTIVPGNFMAGKVIDVFITNFAGSTKTITHGVAANNSTIGSTTKQMASGSTMYLKYISYDGDLANTYVAISYN